MIDATLNATLISREILHDDLHVIRVKLDDQTTPEFKPGQFCTLGLPPKDEPVETNPKKPSRRPRLVRRAYSIASSPNDESGLEIFIVLVPDGQFTPMLWDVAVGEKVWMDPKLRGHFTLDAVPHGKDIIMVSTGTGLAPFMSMLRTFQQTPNRWNRLVMIHGVRYEIDLGYRDELTEIAAADDRVTYIPACTREPDGSDWTGYRGRVNTILDKQTFRNLTGFNPTPEDCHIMLCGNPAMIDQVQQDFEGRGWITAKGKTKGNLHFERYW